jgi:hypothetical protein
LVEGDRSAAPPISQGSARAMAFSTLPEDIAAGHALGVGGEAGRSASQPSGSAGLHPIELLGRSGYGGAVGRMPSPVGAQRRPARADAGGEMLRNAVGHQEFRILRPAVEFLGQAHFSSPSGSPCAALVSCLCGAP